MRLRIQLLLLLAAGIMLGWSACKKYEDPPPTKGDNRLTNHYCNDPRAINYNWGFPGIADNSVCVYPVDSFIGTWKFMDSVFLEDQTFKSFAVKDLVFSATEDTLMTHLAVTGWCNDKILYATADKYKRAFLDSLMEGISGQLLCTPTDTITGFFNQSNMGKDSMEIELTVTGNTGVLLHKGWAIKQ